MRLDTFDSATLTGCSFAGNSAKVSHASYDSSVCELCLKCLCTRWRCHTRTSCVCQAASHVMHAGTAKTAHQMHECCACCKPPISAPGAPASECCTALLILVHGMQTVVDLQGSGGAMNLDDVSSATLAGCSFSGNSAGVRSAVNEQGHGGAMSLSNVRSAMLTSCTFSGNDAKVSLCLY